MDDKLEAKWITYWEKLSQEFEVPPDEDVYDLLRAAFLSSLREAEAEGYANATRVDSTRGEVKFT